LWFEQHELSLRSWPSCRIADDTAEELLDCGAIAPLELRVPADLRFGSAALRAARAARRLRSDFELDLQALVLALACSSGWRISSAAKRAAGAPAAADPVATCLGPVRSSGQRAKHQRCIHFTFRGQPILGLVSGLEAAPFGR